MCDTYFSGIREDKRLPYYSEVDKCLNLYAYQIVIGGSYGRCFKLVKIPGIVFHYGFIVRGAVRGGTSGAIYRPWQMSADYDYDIVQGMNYWCWIQIKKGQKLCNDDTATSKVQEG